MSVNGAVWGRVRRRLRAFPEHLAACGAEVRSGWRWACRGSGIGGDSGQVPVPSGLPSGLGVWPVRAGVHRPGRPPE